LQSINCAIKSFNMRRDVFQAIADPVRRDIISLIANNPMTPNSVSENFGISRQAVSKHIQILTECGILRIKLEGRERHYSIQPKKLAEVDDWISPFRKMWDGRFDRLENLIHQLKNKKNVK